LTIAGSDSGGGAGIQADLKTFAAMGVHGTTAITALTAQNTMGVRQVHAVPAAFVSAQLDAIFEDFEVAAVKTGMLANAGIIEAVAASLRIHAPVRLIVDPVMVSTSGDPLLDPRAVAALREHLLPLAELVTPNLPEAYAILGHDPGIRDVELVEAAREIAGMGPTAVMITGGHGEGDAEDLLHDGSHAWRFSAKRVPTTSTHGTGCTLSAAITALVAKGRPLREAIELAKEYVTEALRTAQPLGHGHGPLHHFHEFYGGEGLP